MEPNANDKARKVAEEALNRLSAELEAGRSEGLKNYLAAMSRFRRYSWGNVLLIASQRPTATHGRLADGRSFWPERMPCCACADLGCSIAGRP